MKRLLIIATMALAGCTTQLGHFTVYSPNKIEMTGQEYTVDKSKRVTGVDSANIYVVIPSNSVTYDNAVTAAMKKVPGCVGLADMTLRREAFWLLFGYCDIVAEGYPIVKKGGK